MKILSILFLCSLLIGQLVGISPFSGVVIYLHDIFLVFLIIFSIKKFRREKLFIPISIFVVSCLLSLSVNSTRFSLSEIATGSLYLVRWVFYASLYFIVLKEKNKKFWLTGLYFAGTGLGVLGLVQFFMYPYLRNLSYLGWDPHYYRVFSTLFDPNFTGIILVLTLLIGFRLTREHKKNYFLLLAQTVTCVALLLTYSRSSYAALAATILFWSVITKRWRLLWVIAGFVLLVYILPHAPGSPVDLMRIESTLARVGNWKQSLTLISKAPVFGYGFNTLRYVQGKQDNETGVISKSGAGLDSSILFIIATTGITGIAAYMYLLVSMIKRGRKSLMYLASLVAILTHSIFVNSMFYSWVMIWMWILTGYVTYDT